MTNMLLPIADKFIKALESEIQEKVLCHGLEMFGLWSVHFKGELQPKVINWFTKGLDTKAQAVRTSYLQWFLNCMRNATLPPATDFSSSLMKLIEKAAQNSNQNPVVIEGLAAASIVLSTTTTKSDNLQSFWNIVLDMNKELFVSEKFVASISNESLCSAISLSERLLTFFLDDLKGEPNRLYKAIVYGATANTERARDCALSAIKRLVTSSNGIHLAQNLLDELTIFIQAAKLSADSDPTEDGLIAAQVVS